MNPLDAAFHVVHDYPGGAAALAPRLGKSSTTLCHEVKPPSSSMAKFGLMDAIKVTAFADDDRILLAWAELRHYQCVRVHIPEKDLQKDLLAAVSVFAKETGEALTAMHQAIADGRITDNEVRKFEKQVADIGPAAIALAARMRAIASQQSKLRAVGGKAA